MAHKTKHKNRTSISIPLPDLQDPVELEEVKLEPAFSLTDSSYGPGHVLVIISDDQLGMGDQVHGQALLVDFLNGLLDRSIMPDQMVFYAKGVLLLATEHPVATVLEKLSRMDIEMKVCQESLDFYKQEPTISKIQPAPMSQITQDILRADRVIHP